MFRWIVIGVLALIGWWLLHGTWLGVRHDVHDFFWWMFP